MRIYIGLLILGVGISLTACSLPTQNASTIPKSPNVDPAEEKLAEAADSVSKSLQSLAENQQALYPKPKQYREPDPSDYGMSNLTSMNWSGPIEPLVTQIAKATGYKLRVSGVSPAIPILVSINAKDIPLGQILRDAGYQCGDRADIVVFTRSKVIELLYANK
jgi:defect-in-organelle-trafficking protein DotD